MGQEHPSTQSRRRSVAAFGRFLPVATGRYGPILTDREHQARTIVVADEEKTGSPMGCRHMQMDHAATSCRAKATSTESPS